jgi:GMP synthase (glutamine-hydrolysing)
MGAVPPHLAFLQHSATDVPGLLGELADGFGLDRTDHRADHGPSGLPAPGSFDLLVVMGSIESVTDATVDWIEPERRLVAGAVAAGIPVLGVCFGGQLLAQVLGGTVTRAVRPEIGWRTVVTSDPSMVGAGPWLDWHGDAFDCPPGAEAMAHTDVSLHAFVHGVHTGVQFHPEVTEDVVHAWIADARDRDGIPDDQVADLLQGFDDRGRGPDDQTRALFHGFLTRAGVTI